MLKRLRQKKYIIKGKTKQVKPHIEIIEDFLSRNDSLKYKLISILQFEIYLCYLNLGDNNTKLLKLINSNSIFNLKYTPVKRELDV
jgi:hypothetical protein